VSRRRIGYRDAMEPFGDQAHLSSLAREALKEDLGGVVDVGGDITAQLVVPRGRSARAQIVCKAPGVLAGMAVVKRCFQELDREVRFPHEAAEGSEVEPGQVVLEIAGNGQALLAAERTALNFLQRLSGIATRTRAYVAAVGDAATDIMNTRKTTPMLRELERQAVVLGGGVSHRRGLFDQILLKENHFALAESGYEETVRTAAEGSRGPVIAEARDLEEALAAVRGGAAVVMLDNVSPEAGLAHAVEAIRKTASDLGRDVLIEASGGVNLGNVRAYAEAGVDRISVGGLTHSAPALDFSMLIGDRCQP
jgi:nicotinate-nucleotide pyrophosphorylase (carboxylating)